MAVAGDPFKWVKEGSPKFYVKDPGAKKGRMGGSHMDPNIESLLFLSLFPLTSYIAVLIISITSLGLVSPN